MRLLSAVFLVAVLFGLLVNGATPSPTLAGDTGPLNPNSTNKNPDGTPLPVNTVKVTAKPASALGLGAAYRTYCAAQNWTNGCLAPDTDIVVRCIFSYQDVMYAAADISGYVAVLAKIENHHRATPRFTFYMMTGKFPTACSVKGDNLFFLLDTFDVGGSDQINNIKIAMINLASETKETVYLRKFELETTGQSFDLNKGTWAYAMNGDYYTGVAHKAGNNQPFVFTFVTTDPVPSLGTAIKCATSSGRHASCIAVGPDTVRVNSVVSDGSYVYLVLNAAAGAATTVIRVAATASNFGEGWTAEDELDLFPEEYGVTGCAFDVERRRVTCATPGTGDKPAAQSTTVVYPRLARVDSVEFKNVDPFICGDFDCMNIVSGVFDDERGHSYWLTKTNPVTLVDVRMITDVPGAELWGAGQMVGTVSLPLNSTTEQLWKNVVWWDKKNRLLFAATTQGKIFQTALGPACPDSCSGHGTCKYGVCTCNPNWKGDNCGIEIKCINDCFFRGQCAVGQCVCPYPYHGVDCGMIHCPLDCSGPSHGDCNSKTGVCTCKVPWGGVGCNLPLAPAVPGSTDFVGIGMDARKGVLGPTTPEFMQVLKAPVLDYSFEQTKSYFYPTTPELLYLVPDQMVLLPLGTQVTHTNVVENKNAELFKAGFWFGIEFSTPVVGFSLKVSFEFRKFKQNEQVTVQNTGSSQLYRLAVVNPDRLSGQVLQALNEGQAYKTSKSQMQAWGKAFVEKFGTHYVDSTIVGGSITMESSASKNGKGTGFSLGLMLGLRYTMIGIRLELGISIDTKEVTSKATSNIYIEGGDSTFGGFITDPGLTTSGSAMEQWQQTIVTSPVPVEYTVREIWRIIPDKVARYFICAATESILAYPSNKRVCS